MVKNILILIMICMLNVFCFSCDANERKNNLESVKNAKDDLQITQVNFNFSIPFVKINPMIYGQMLEDCNDRIIYGGVVNDAGKENIHVTELLKPLNIPVMRWPGGTFVHEYQWENGIGPIDFRPVYNDKAWGGTENHTFGTDEFLQWCRKLDIKPYINFNMSTHPTLGGTVQDALNWIEYVNGPKFSEYGKKRVENGHAEPYNVKYWGIGNENWGSFGVNTMESANEYAARLNMWAKDIRKKYPDLILLGVGHSLEWDNKVLESNGSLVDLITQHYYVNSKVIDDKIVNPLNTILAPIKMENHLIMVGKILNNANTKHSRNENPIKVSVDEWNNRHQVWDNGKYKFTRNDPRRQFDVAVVAGMLNAFIRQASTVGMANYIFPVNGHGLIRTVGENDAFKSSIYGVFELYRRLMIGQKIELQLKGPGVLTSELDLSIVGDCNEIDMGNQSLNYVDGAAVLSPEGSINIALVNRSPEVVQEVKIDIPAGFKAIKKWEISHPDINAFNSPTNRENITPKSIDLANDMKNFEISPCGLIILELAKKK